MSLVYDDGVVTSGYLCAPGVGLFGFDLGGVIGRIGTCDVEETPHYEGELLDSGDHYLGAIHQRLSQLLGVLVNVFDHAFDVLNLVDCILELLVQHPTVGNDDDAVKHGVVGIVVQVGQLVRQPRYCVRLAAAGGMLDQVVMAGALVFGCFDQLGHGVQLMVSGENCRLAGDGSRTVFGVLLPLGFLNEYVVADDF